MILASPSVSISDACTPMPSPLSPIEVPTLTDSTSTLVLVIVAVVVVPARLMPGLEKAAESAVTLTERPFSSGEIVKSTSSEPGNMLFTTICSSLTLSKTAVSALKSAITVLSKHHGGALMQVPRSHVLGIAAALQNEMQKHSSLLSGILTHSQRKVVEAFVQAPEDYFDAAPTFKQSYAPQSGEIFGILKQMKETFETNLSDTQKEELTNQKAYEDLKSAKEEEIAAGQSQIDAKTQELASTDEKLAQAKEDIEDTKNNLSADEEFLLMLKEKCSTTDAEWEERQKTRQLEIEACSKALAILSSDDAHDTFTKTFNPAFLQVEVESSSSRRAQAANLLAQLAKKVGNPRLATLASQVKLDAFTKVKKAIDDMVTQLLKEKEDEIKHKDFCTDEFNKNQLETEKKERERQDRKSTL